MVTNLLYFYFKNTCSRKNSVFLFGAWFNSTIRVDIYFHPIRMTYPIQLGPSFRAAQIGEAANTFFSQNFFVQDRHLTVCSSIAAAASHHYEESHLIYGPLASILLDQGFPSWIWIRWIQYATHRNNFWLPPVLAMSTAMQNSAPTHSYFTSGQHFLETFMLLPETTRTTNSWGL